MMNELPRKLFIVFYEKKSINKSRETSTLECIIRGLRNNRKLQASERKVLAKTTSLSYTDSKSIKYGTYSR
eukprot:1395448-Amorphochlora_amoeboformis.AAC.1